VKSDLDGQTSLFDVGAINKVCDREMFCGIICMCFRMILGRTEAEEAEEAEEEDRWLG
jgi:hypothetical protein